MFKRRLRIANRKLLRVLRILPSRRCHFAVIFIIGVTSLSLFYCLLQWNVICLNVDIENQLNDLVSLLHYFKRWFNVWNIIFSSVKTITQERPTGICANRYAKNVTYTSCRVCPSTQAKWLFSRLGGTTPSSSSNRTKQNQIILISIGWAMEVKFFQLSMSFKKCCLSPSQLIWESNTKWTIFFHYYFLLSKIPQTSINTKW